MAKKVQNRTAIKKAAMLKAMQKHLGNISHACKEAKIGRQTFYDWTSKDPEFKNQIDEITEESFDFVESKIFEQIKEGNVPILIFYAKTKMKHRGYVERIETRSLESFKIVVANERDKAAIESVMSKHRN